MREWNRRVRYVRREVKKGEMGRMMREDEVGMEMWGMGL